MVGFKGPVPLDSNLFVLSKAQSAFFLMRIKRGSGGTSEHFRCVGSLKTAKRKPEGFVLPTGGDHLNGEVSDSEPQDPRATHQRD